MEKHLLFKRFADKRLHLGVCGSVAAFRAAELVHRWQDTGAGVSATLTAAAQKFITPLTFEALGASPVYGEMFGGEAPFEHLEPGQIAHAMVIAPASADMLARLAQGRACDMLSAQALAFDGPIVPYGTIFRTNEHEYMVCGIFPQGKTYPYQIKDTATGKTYKASSFIIRHSLENEQEEKDDRKF